MMSAGHSSRAFRPEKLMFQMQVPADESAVARLFERGEAAIPGGVCSSTRRNQAWDSPVYAQRAAGSRCWDVAGREFLDFSMSHGATLLGHAPECLRHVFATAWEHGVLCSMDTPCHVDLAEQLCRVVPCAERIRFTGSGSEATLHALRLCRAASGRDKIIRFFGHFHGYHEFTLIGGHPAAAGLTILPENIPAFHEVLEGAVQEQKGAPPFTASLAPDLELDPESLDLAMVDELNQLAPFGEKNPEPLFLSKGLPVQSRRVVGQTHLKLVLGQARHDAIAFGLGEHLHSLGSHVDVLYRIERNVFRGNETLQLKIEDLRSSPPLS